jgi:hypothetical protein
VSVRRVLPTFEKAIAAVRGWFREGHVRASAQEALRSIDDVLDVVEETAGALNFNDALVVVLERKGFIDNLASFWATVGQPFARPQFDRGMLPMGPVRAAGR